MQSARVPAIEFGSGSSSQLASLAQAYGVRLLLITGKYSFELLNNRQELLQQIESSELHLVAHLQVSGEPSPQQIDQIVAAHTTQNIELVVAIGGGSVLDAAKAVAGLLPSGESVMAYLEGVGRGEQYDGNALPFIALPTTAGTGSEVSMNTVHGLAGPIGGLFKIPHGVVCGTLLAEANRVNIEVLLARDDTSIDMVAERIALHKYATISEKLGFAQQSDSIEIKLQALIEGLRGWVELMKIPKLSQFGVAERDLNMILSLSDQKANPIKLTQAEFAEILRTRW